MAGPRGYSNYRGRGSRAKTALTVVLVLIIAASLGFLALQKNIVYDENGRPYLLPWQKDDQQAAVPEAPKDLDITIQEPEVTETAMHAFTVSETPLTVQGWQAARAAAPDDPAAAVTMKDAAGLVYFDTNTAVSGTIRTAADTADALADMTGADTGVWSIARMSCFLDPRAANADVEAMGLKNTGGYIFYDGNNRQWLDPAKPAARQYLCTLAKELAEKGFDEILLTDVSYPTEGKLDKIAYGETMKNQNIVIFLEEMKAALAAYDVTLSIELPEAVVAQGADSFAGLSLAEIAPRVDRVYTVTAPEQISGLAAAVTAAGGETAFVPELTASAPDWEGSSLLLSAG